MKHDKLIAKLRKAHDDFKSLGKPIRLDINLEDILGAFDELKLAAQKWVSPKDKLPTEGQEVEFVAPYQYVCGNTYRKRFQGHFRKLDDKTDVQIFYAHSIGWGCEFAIDEVECWMPKMPMPEVAKEE